MEEINFNDLRKKINHIGFRVSEYERKQMVEFCKKEQITITDFLRYAIRVAINQRTEK